MGLWEPEQWTVMSPWAPGLCPRHSLPEAPRSLACPATEACAVRERWGQAGGRLGLWASGVIPENVPEPSRGLGGMGSVQPRGLRTKAPSGLVLAHGWSSSGAQPVWRQAGQDLVVVLTGWGSKEDTQFLPWGLGRVGPPKMGTRRLEGVRGGKWLG